MANQWKTSKPPNDTLVEVEHQGQVIRVKAFFGREGYHPSWQSEDGASSWHPSCFTRWREINPVVPIDDAQVCSGKTAAEWYSLYCQQSLHLAGAQVRIDKLEDVLKSVVRDELPEAELDDEAPGDLVVFSVSHMDHESYRHTVRRAKELVK